MTYESPIELLITDVQNQIVKQQDEEIYKAVLHYIPKVDREELLRALQYDRQQYEKGYRDGQRDAFATENNVGGKWIPVSERLPEDEKLVLCLTNTGWYWIARYNDCGDEMWCDGESWASKTYITHWMPLPKPPEV
jgi:hypothetical protein